MSALHSIDRQSCFQEGAERDLLAGFNGLFAGNTALVIELVMRQWTVNIQQPVFRTFVVKDVSHAVGESGREYATELQNALELWPHREYVRDEAV